MVAPVREQAVKGHPGDSPHRLREEDIEASVRAARKARNALMNAIRAGIVDAPTIAKEVVRVADTVYESRSIAKDRAGLVFSADAAGYLRTRSSRATGDNDAVPDGELVVEKHSKLVTNVVGEDARPVPSEVPRSASQPLVSMVSSSGAKSADMFSFRSHSQELRVYDVDLLSCQAGNQKLHMDMLLKLCTETKKLLCWKLKLHG